MRNLILLVILFAGFSIWTGCGNGSDQNSSANQGNLEANKPMDPMQDKGVGPVKKLVLPATIDEEMAARGSEIYVAKCTACHKVDQKYIGPAPLGILERRSPEWIMNMILNPEVMIEKNEIAKQLLMEFNGAPMANQNLTEDEARAILEYFRTLK